MDIAHNIKRRRMELNLSQQELAQAVGYRSRSTIAKIEGGEIDPPLSKLMSFSVALDTTVEALLTGSRPAWEESASVPAGDGKGNIAIILAGGKSTRNMQNIPNQFINVLGKPVIVYCLEVYQSHPLIDDIFVVCTDEWKAITAAYARQYGIGKLRGIVPAGETGVLSVRNALEWVQRAGASPATTVVLQESTRPFVTEEMVSKLLQSCAKEGHAIICEPMSDNVQFMLDGGSARYLERSKVVDLQSPEAYRAEVLGEVFRQAERRGHPLKESCTGMLRYNLGMPLNFCEGTHNNIKIVRQEDIAIFTALLKHRD